mmetsp:Transcript_67647/g.197994  ORF Transcript_67647/g.197994 Transcript_67647/m.197994 type:complete len:213 (+) Transcript_67647:271-909(+)
MFVSIFRKSGVVSAIGGVRLPMRRPQPRPLQARIRRRQRGQRRQPAAFAEVRHRQLRQDGVPRERAVAAAQSLPCSDAARRRLVLVVRQVQVGLPAGLGPALAGVARRAPALAVRLRPLQLRQHARGDHLQALPLQASSSRARAQAPAAAPQARVPLGALPRAPVAPPAVPAHAPRLRRGGLAARGRLRRCVLILMDLSLCLARLPAPPLPA